MNSNDIMSGGKVYAFFFGFKLIMLGWLGVVSTELYYGHEYDWLMRTGLLLFLIVLGFIGDAYAIPIEKTPNGIKFHHLWRVSVLANEDIRKISIKSYARNPMERIKGEGILIAVGKRWWNLHIAYVDTKNDLEEYYFTNGFIDTKTL